MDIIRDKNGRFTKGQISLRKGKYLSEETKGKISKAKKGKHCSINTEFKKGRIISKEIRDKISKTLKGKYTGSKCSSWKGGISSERYSVDWTDDLKRAIRKRDKYTCQVCGCEPAIYVHHIDYNKQNCNPGNLITLCCSCHIKTNFKRDYWKIYFEIKRG